MFYFGSYESTRDKQNATRTISVPTEALRRGDLSASSTPIYDPQTGNANGTGRTPFQGNIIPDGRIDPIAQKIIDLMPLPNLPGETNNYFVAAPFEFNRWTLDTKVNWNATSKLNIFGRYSHLDFWTFNEAVYGDTLQGVPIAGGNPGTGQGYTANFSTGGTYVFSPGLVADAHFGYVRMYTDVAHTDIGQNKGMDMFGIPGLNGTRAVRGRHAGLRFRHLSGYRHHRALHAVHPERRSVSDGGQCQLDEGQAQRACRHGHLLPGAESHPARVERRR